ncbi:hypothetical protein [Bordetella trematum]|uniref:hypothetical protein n=1 Tax=Bordetella trematum TaxID=123899 RepID=UPI0013FDB8BD|nr:hypothetical protein [Bordetella trematum]
MEVSAHDIEQRLKTAHEKLCAKFSDVVTYDIMSAAINDDLCKPHADDELPDLRADSLMAPVPQRFIAVSILAYYYYAQSLLLAKQGLVQKSQHALNQALGQCIDFEKFADAQFDLSSHSEAAQAGGAAKARKLDPVKDRIVELMYEKCPEEGWKSKASFIRDIEQDVVDASAGLLKASNIDRTLNRWLSQDKRLRDHFATLRSARKPRK